MNFTELFESAKRTKTDDLIALAEMGIIDWPIVVNRAFDNDDIAVIYWESGGSSTGYFQPTFVFAHDRTVRGTAMHIKYGGKNMANDAASEAYEAGAKMVINLSDIGVVRYDNNNKSVKIAKDSIREILSITKRTFDRSIGKED